MKTLTIDAHLDVPWQWEKNGFFQLDTGHFRSAVTLDEMKRGGLQSAIFALYLSGVRQDKLMWPSDVLKAIKLQIENVAKLKGCQLVTAVDEALVATGMPIFLGMEGGRLIQHNLGVLRDFAPAIQYLTLTHNDNVEWAGSSTDAVQKGLNAFGRNVVKVCEEMGVLVDLSHTSDQTVLDVMMVCKKPVIASHSGCRALTDHPRNLTDDQIKAICSTGGMVGVPFAWKFVGKWATDVLNHIDHICELVGDTKHVGIGSDIDGAAMINGFTTVADWDMIVRQGLQSRGWSDEDIANVAGGNWQRRLRQTALPKGERE